MRAWWLLFLFAPAAFGDIVYLKSGGKVEGVVKDAGDAIEVTSANGTVKIARDQVDHVEKKEYVPPARPKGDEPPAAPVMGEHYREPFLGVEIQLPYGWTAGEASRGSICTFSSKSAKGSYRPKLDVQATKSAGTVAEILEGRRKGFEGTFAETQTKDEPSFTAGELAFLAFSAEFKFEGKRLHSFQAAAEAGEMKFVLSATCDAEETERVQAEALRSFATFKRLEPITKDLEKIERFRAALDLGVAEYKKGNTEGSIAAYKKAAEEIPEHPMPWQNLGLIFASRNRLEEAVAAYVKLCALMPDNVVAHFNLATVYRQQGKYEDARTMYEKVLTLDPRHAESYVNLSAVYQMKNDTPLAIRCARTAIAIEPDNASAHFNLAQLLNMQQKTAEAIAEYERVLAIDPKHKLAREELDRIKK